jgi:hypothetical protein
MVRVFWHLLAAFSSAAIAQTRNVVLNHRGLNRVSRSVNGYGDRVPRTRGRTLSSLAARRHGVSHEACSDLVSSMAGPSRSVIYTGLLLAFERDVRAGARRSQPASAAVGSHAAAAFEGRRSTAPGSSGKKHILPENRRLPFDEELAPELPGQSRRCVHGRRGAQVRRQEAAAGRSCWSSATAIRIAPTQNFGNTRDVAAAAARGLRSREVIVPAICRTCPKCAGPGGVLRVDQPARYGGSACCWMRLRDTGHEGRHARGSI